MTIGVPRFFPPPGASPGTRPLAYGGQLSTDWLLDAYSHGIFPWPVSERRVTWWSPDPRPTIDLHGMHVSRRLARTCRSGKFRVTCDREFAGVIAACATVPRNDGGTWITASMQKAYNELHRLGYAHSIEVWHGRQLAGGLYGVSLGGAFFAESKFHIVTDASKVALVFLVEHLRARGFLLLDIQQLTPHTATFGAQEMPRAEFLIRLDRALRCGASFGSELEPSERFPPQVATNK